MLALIKKRAPGLDLLEDARERLAEALRNVDVQRAEAERWHAAEREIDLATRKAAEAKQRARDERQRWMQGGSKFSGLRALQDLDGEAATAAQAAEQAAKNAGAFRYGQGHAEDALKSSELEIGRAQTRVREMVGAIVAAEASDLLRDLERAADQYRAARERVMGVLRVVDPPYPAQSPCRSATGGSLIQASLDKSRIHEWDRERANQRAADHLHGTTQEEDLLEQLAAPWRARAAELLEDST